MSSQVVKVKQISIAQGEFYRTYSMYCITNKDNMISQAQEVVQQKLYNFQYRDDWWHHTCAQDTWPT